MEIKYVFSIKTYPPAMTNIQRWTIRITAISLLTATLLACTHVQNKKEAKPVLSVSILPLKTIIDRLSDQYYQVNVMIPKNVGHSDYSPTARQMKDLSNSDAYLAIGPLDFELTWGDRLRSVSPDMPWIDLSQGIELIDGHICNHEEEHAHHHESAFDPHYWMSPQSAIKMVDNIKNVLIKLHPENQTVIEKNYESLQLELTNLHRQLTTISHDNDSLTFMIYHPALGYLARHYGFTQIEIEENGKAPTPAGLRRKIEQARKHKVQILFIQTNFDINNAQTAAKEIGARIVQINPESDAWPLEIQQITNYLSEIK